MWCTGGEQEAILQEVTSFFFGGQMTKKEEAIINGGEVANGNFRWGITKPSQWVIGP